MKTKITREQALAAYAEHGSYAAAGRAIGVSGETVRRASDPEYHERVRERARERKREQYANDPEYRARVCELERSPEYRERARERKRSPEYRERERARRRERYANDP